MDGGGAVEEGIEQFSVRRSLTALWGRPSRRELRTLIVALTVGVQRLNLTKEGPDA